MISQLLIKLLKYVAIAAAIYLIFRFVPNNSSNMVTPVLQHGDIILLTTVIILVLVLIETLSNALYENMSNSYDSMPQPLPQSTCQNTCSTKSIEKMADVSIAVNKDSVEVKKESNTASNDVNVNVSVKKEDNPVQEQKADYHPVDAVTKFADPITKTGVERSAMRSEEGVMKNESVYSDYHHVPMAENYNTGSFEYGYSFLPPEKWYPTPPFPPVCVAEKQCPVCPVFTTGTPVDVKEWDNSRRVTQPDNINTKYIKDKLNSGR